MLFTIFGSRCDAVKTTQALALNLATLLTLVLSNTSSAETVVLRREINIDQRPIAAPDGIASVADPVNLRLYMNYGEREDFPDAPPPPALGPPVLDILLFADSPAQLLSVDSGPAFEAAKQNLLSGDFEFRLQLGYSGEGGLVRAVEATDISRIELQIEDEPFELTERSCPEPCNPVLFDSSLRSTLTIYGIVPEPTGGMGVGGGILAVFLRRKRRRLKER